ncbi:Growth factor receptor-bound protein 10 [Pteropus alecto]|uniref:Growth factor receptor-bound protein 10 n=1 Tax=Pteropus alecto TaxID=9402 RepID=L5KM05_PTEAL|nr:Growth factor receptor-bound protein 10 [Pteropus alecto]
MLTASLCGAGGEDGLSRGSLRFCLWRHSLATVQADQAEQTSAHSPGNLASSSPPARSDQRASHQEDDVDLEALMNDMNSSMESLFPASSMQSDTVPLRQNGQHTHGQPPPAGARPLQPQASGRQKVQRSQPVHILAARRLQEQDQQFRTSSLPAIPNPFPELTGTRSPPGLEPSSLPPPPPPPPPPPSQVTIAKQGKRGAGRWLTFSTVEQGPYHGSDFDHDLLQVEAFPLDPEDDSHLFKPVVCTLKEDCEVLILRPCPPGGNRGPESR